MGQAPEQNDVTLKVLVGMRSRYQLTTYSDSCLLIPKTISSTTGGTHHLCQSLPSPNDVTHTTDIFCRLPFANIRCGQLTCGLCLRCRTFRVQHLCRNMCQQLCFLEWDNTFSRLFWEQSLVLKAILFAEFVVEWLVFSLMIKHTNTSPHFLTEGYALPGTGMSTEPFLLH